MSDITPRDIIWFLVLDTDGKIRWTTKEMIKKIDRNISEDTVRDTFNVMCEFGIMQHKFSSRYWYVEQEYL